MRTSYEYQSQWGAPVIHLSRLHDAGSIVINADLIETIEACPDTTITLMTKRKFVVADSLESVVDKIINYRGRINAAVAGMTDEPLSGAAPIQTLQMNDKAA